MEDMADRIEVARMRWHRNGVGGIGFYSVEFNWKDDDNNYRKMIATVFPEANGRSPEYYAVLDIGSPAERWRGDHFIAALWNAITEEENRKELHSL